jgi:hypothetical protein
MSSIKRSVPRETYLSIIGLFHGISGKKRKKKKKLK